MIAQIVIFLVKDYRTYKDVMREKGIPLEDFKYLVAYHKGNEAAAKHDVMNLTPEQLKTKIVAMRAFSEHVGDELSGGFVQDEVATLLDSNNTSIFSSQNDSNTQETLSALPEGYEIEETHVVESDFNPFDGVTWIVGAGGNAVPFAGVSTDVSILFDSNDMVAIVDGGAGTFGVPNTGVAFKFGISTADDYRDVLGSYYSIGGSIGEGVSIGGELTGGVSDGRLKNLTFTVESGVGISALPAEGHFSIGGTESEPIWVGTKEEFWEKVDEEYKDFIEYTMDNFDKPPAWDFNYYNSLP